MIPATFALLTVLSGPPIMPPVCPADRPHFRRSVRIFLTYEDYAPWRHEAGFMPSDTAAVRVLTDATDAVACARINLMVAPGGEIGPTAMGPWVFYKIRNRYFLESEAPEPGWLSHNSIVVLDENFNILHRFFF